MQRKLTSSIKTRSELPRRTTPRDDATDGAAGLRDLVEVLLHQAAQGADGGTATHESRMRDASRLACGAAHERGLTIEQLVVLIKDVWRELPHTASLLRTDSYEILGRAVTECIREYYEPHRQS
jgi:hypothetical protein